MMRVLSRVITYLLHPLLIPVYGILFYFRMTPKFHTLEFQGGNVLPVFILTVIIPIVSLLIFRNLGLMRSNLLLRARERIYPMLIFLGLMLMILFRVIPNHYTPEIYFFCLGIITATTACLLQALAGKVVSLHMAGIGSLLLYMIALSIHFEKNIVLAISLCTFCTGLIASSRLYLRAHGRAAVLAGWLIGLVSQLILLQFWV